MAANMATMAAMMQNMQMSNANPEVVILPKPPMFTDNLARNDLLSRASKYVQNMVIGPESMVVRNRYIYTGLQDGWVVEVIPPPPFGSGPRVRRILRMSTPECESRVQDESSCGRPLGVRADKQGYLVVADAYKGIYRINPQNGRYKQLFNTANKVKGETVGFINDLAIADDGTIIFTSSSQRHNRTEYLDVVIEGETTGKVLVYNPRLAPPNQVQELASNLGFPNGIELAADNSYVLIAEGSRAKIHRVWIGANTAKRGRLEVFADNLPGFIDNIRRTPRGTYWVGISSIRSAELPSVLDRFGDKPMMRQRILGLPREQLMAQSPKWGMVVELNEDGQIIRSLQDPEGRVFTAVSEVQEEDGLLYFGSFDRPYIGILNETLLPRPKLPTPEATAPAGPDNGAGTGAGGSTGGTANTGGGTGAGSGTGGSVPTPGTGGGPVPTPGTGGGWGPNPGTAGGWVPNPGTGGGSVPTPGTGGGPVPTPGTGGGPVPTPGTGGGSVPTPGTGGGSVPTPGTGGGWVPNPGTGGGATAGQNGGTPGTNPNDNGIGTDNSIVNFLERVRSNARGMTRNVLEESVVNLVQRLIEGEIRQRRATERGDRLQAELNSLNNLLASSTAPGTGSGTGSGQTGTVPPAQTTTQPTTNAAGTTASAAGTTANAAGTTASAAGTTASAAGTTAGAAVTTPGAVNNPTTMSATTAGNTRK